MRPVILQLVYNLQLPHITSNILMDAMVIIVAMVMVVMVVVVNMVFMVVRTGQDRKGPDETEI